MEKIKLTKREYIGEGYYHQFEKPDTKEIQLIETTKDQYEKMGGENGKNYNPTPPEGWIHVFSFGGSLKVEGGDNFMQENEFCIKDGRYYVIQKNQFGELYVNDYSEEEFNSKFIWP